jgi:ribosomal protein S18 acetylase RimI-like enzyme
MAASVSTFSIRPAAPSELDAVGGLTADVYGAEFDIGRPYLDVLVDAKRRADAAHTDVLVAADPAGTVIGSVTYCGPGSPYANLAREGEAEIRMLVVATSARRRGVGDALVRGCLDRARRDGVAAVVLSTKPGAMAPAQRLYSRLGFGRVPERDWSPEPGVHLAAYLLSMPEVLIRDARADEYDALGELTLAAYRADGWLDGDEAYAAQLRNARERARAPSTRLLAAVDARTERPLGSVTFVLPGSPLTEIARPDEAEFRMLGVDPAERGRGLARLMVQACVDRARAAGCRRLVLSTYAALPAAERLYGGFGFRRDPERDWEPEPGLALVAYVAELDGA